MPSSTSTVIVYSSDPSKEVSIAGNFTGWTPQKLIYNAESKRFEHTVTPTDDNGKLSFKFIVDGNWIIDQNFASEFDEMGNENNVIIYDHTNEKTPSKERDVSSQKAVETDNKESPATPDPTPMDASPAASTPSSTAHQTPTQPIPVVITTPAEPDKEVEPESTVASKSLPKTAFPAPPAITELPKQPTTTDAAPLESTEAEVPKPEPVARPTIPEATDAPTTTAPTSKSLSPAAPSEPSLTTAATAETATTDNASVTSVISNNHNIANRDGAAGVPKDWNFFANLLHLIAEFFKNWFSRGAAA